VPSFCRAGYVMSKTAGILFWVAWMVLLVTAIGTFAKQNEAPEPRPRVYANGDGEQASTKVARNRKRQTAKFSADRCTRYE
jgi:hypothetical protein